MTTKAAMSRGKNEATLRTTYLSTWFYKRNQGRLVRRLTSIAIGAIVLLGCWTLSIWIRTNISLGENESRWVPLAIPGVVAALGLWFAFRVVHYPRFADFLIAVEAEMDKVSWPTWEYLRRATAVVLGMMFFLGALLWLFDYFWLNFFTWVHILDPEALRPTTPPGG